MSFINYDNTTGFNDTYNVTFDDPITPQYEYIMDNIDNRINSGTCSHENENITEVIKIKKDIINILNNNDDIFEENINASVAGNEEINEEINNQINEEINKENDEEINILINNYEKFCENYKKEQLNFFECENNFKKEIENSKNNIKKLDLIVKFMKELDDGSCPDGLTENIIENMKDLSKRIEGNNKISDMRKEYINSRKIINKYLLFIKKLNKMNIANVCPLCLTNAVSVYLTPCGHTCCDSCYDKVEMNPENKCFLCRSKIMQKNSLYFC